MTHVKALQAGHSSQGTSEPITSVRETLGKARGIVYLGVAQVAPWVDRTSPLRGRRLLSEGATRPLWGKQGKTWNPTKAVVCSGIWHGIVAMFELINKKKNYLIEYGRYFLSCLYVYRYHIDVRMTMRLSGDLAVIFRHTFSYIVIIWVVVGRNITDNYHHLMFVYCCETNKCPISIWMV